MSSLSKLFRWILGCEEEDHADRSYSAVPRRTSAPPSESYFPNVSSQVSESYRIYIPPLSATSAATRTSESYQAPAPHSSTGSSGGGGSGSGGGVSSTDNTRSAERNHQVLQNSSQTIYSPRASSIPPKSSSSSSVNTLSFQPAALSLSDPIKPQSKPTVAIASPSKPAPRTPLLPPKSTVSPPTQLSSSSELPSSSFNSLLKFKPTLSPAPSTSANQQTQSNYVWVENGSSPIYQIPKDIEDMIKNDIVPGVLRRPLSPSTYADYFAALLYAEDYYVEKWSNFLLKKVPLVLEQATIGRCGEENKVFVAFEIDAVPEKRPFLLSRDFVFAKPAGKEVEPFKGVIYRVVKSKKVLVEFRDEFHSQHLKGKEYDVSFSFNRVCLKRAHQAIAVASDRLFRSFLFPDHSAATRASVSPPIRYANYRLNIDQMTAVQHILNLNGPSPYLLEGSLRTTEMSLSRAMNLSRAGVVVKEAVLGLYRHSLGTRILVCGPINSALDFVFQSLKGDIPEAEMFRANAAFREKVLVPEDVLSSCLYDDECFICPQLQELKKYRVIFTTFVSAFRLCNEGITAGHFSHIFLIDASTAPEPEVMIPLANLANEKTSVIVMGKEGNRPSWVRSDIARKNGLMVSYYERLRGRHPYVFLAPDFISKVNEK